jgi:anthranilate 1,2-dioxygenase small subunit
MRCENQRMMRDRVISLRNANIFAPATYRHFLSGLRITRVAGDEAEFSCNYLVINSNQLGQSIVYQTGRYHDRAVRTADGWRFTQKRAVFDTSRVQTLLAIPV